MGRPYGKDLRIRNKAGQYRVQSKESIRYAQREYWERGGNQKRAELRTRRQGVQLSNQWWAYETRAEKWPLDVLRMGSFIENSFRSVVEPQALRLGWEWRWGKEMQQRAAAAIILMDLPEEENYWVIKRQEAALHCPPPWLLPDFLPTAASLRLLMQLEGIKCRLGENLSIRGNLLWAWQGAFALLFPLRWILLPVCGKRVPPPSPRPDSVSTVLLRTPTMNPSFGEG